MGRACQYCISLGADLYFVVGHWDSDFFLQSPSMEVSVINGVYLSPHSGYSIRVPVVGGFFFFNL